MHLMGVRTSHGCVPHRYASHRHVPHWHASHLRVFLARRTRVARIPVSTPRMFEACDCGRLGRQAAGHLWSALRVVKSCRKDCPTAKVLPKPKQQLCIQSGTRAHYLHYLQRGGRGGGKKRRQSDWLANEIDRKVMDKQVIDRQVEIRPTRAGTQADRAAS